jgi:hypothetical protein
MTRSWQWPDPNSVKHFALNFCQNGEFQYLAVPDILYMQYVVKLYRVLTGDQVPTQNFSLGGGGGGGADPVAIKNLSLILKIFF